MHEQEYASFGEFLTAKRKEKKITTIRMAEEANISAAYYCDIEKNRRNPPEIEMLQKMIAALNLSEEDKVIFFDLAGKGRSSVSPDLPDYIMENEVVRVALRIAKKKADNKDWQRFIDTLEKKK